MLRHTLLLCAFTAFISPMLVLPPTPAIQMHPHVSCGIEICTGFMFIHIPRPFLHTLSQLHPIPTKVNRAVKVTTFDIYNSTVLHYQKTIVLIRLKSTFNAKSRSDSTLHGCSHQEMQLGLLSGKLFSTYHPDRQTDVPVPAVMAAKLCITAVFPCAVNPSPVRAPGL